MTAYAAFQSRNYRFLLAGTTLSMFGQQMLAVVAGWDLYLATRSPIVLGNVGLVQIVPVLLFTFVAGHVADRYSRRVTAMLTQSAVALLALALSFAGDANRGVAVIYSALFLIATARAFQWPAATAMLAQTVPVESLTNAVSWNGTARETATMAGPALAGAMIAAFGSESVYIAQAIMAVGAAFSFSMIQLPPRPVEDRPQPGLKSTIEGLKFVWADKIILSALCLDTFAVLFGGETALLPIFAEEILKVGPTGLGWLRAAPAVGAGLMSLYLAHRATIHRAGHALLWSVALFGLAIIGFGLATNFYLSLAALFLVGAFDAISVVLRISVVQMRTPDNLRGRVSAVNALFISSSNQWGAVESGLAAELMGVVPAVVFGGSMTLVVVAVIAWLSKSLRDWKN